MNIVELVPQFGGVIYTVVAFVVALSVIVAVHEFGHYIVGRWSGIHAEVFSLGFGPVLFSRVDKRGTRWQIAALPFGGYVKFLGDANAASAGADSETMAEIYRNNPDDLRHTMLGAPLWARAATVAAGPVFNFVLSIAVFTLVFMVQGVPRDPLTVGELHPMPGAQIDLQAGDEILAINGTPSPDYTDGTSWQGFLGDLPVAPTLDYLVRRDGQEITVAGPQPFPAYIYRVVPRSAASDAGLKPGDVITAVEGQPVYVFDQLKQVVEASDGKPLLLTVWRDGEESQFTMTPRRVDEPQADGNFATQWRIGIAGGMAFEPATVTAGPVQAFTGGMIQTWGIITGSLSGMWHMITGAISTCNISGPIGIAETSGQMASQGAQSFISFIAVLSTAVGLLNLFPIPVLDGGHLMFYAYEAVFRRPPSDRALKVLMSVGLALVLSMMVFALGNDLFC
ncbi:RIP metalloprotease RseP [Pseudodonghicola flavimaris]|uniref:Zinc metalloprotease n=1 Tax=Pseudodonghicola flavimaris TaxID=3050036 RepID=A0ABT7F710_9RHOB|nr:RIP metalloprotease RseP [Pseudodonghicola flavimaris]MDK3020382.1 RIP metalloprotease RseP [Pseudodonghicola flavimaris]